MHIYNLFLFVIICKIYTLLLIISVIFQLIFNI